MSASRNAPASVIAPIDPPPLGGRLEGRVHRLGVRVYYEDTDAAGIVYHASYLRYAERGRTELLRAIGIELSDLRRREGLQFVLHSAEMSFLKPARLDDLLTVETRLTALGAASLAVRQDVLYAGRETPKSGLLVRFEAKLACVGEDSRPARMPPELRNKIQAFLSEV